MYAALVASGGQAWGPVAFRGGITTGPTLCAARARTPVSWGGGADPDRFGSTVRSPFRGGNRDRTTLAMGVLTHKYTVLHVSRQSIR